MRITSAERYKGMTRVTFTAARRGRAELFARDAGAARARRAVLVRPADVPAAIDKLRRDADDAVAERPRSRGRLADAIVASRCPATRAVIASVPGDAELLRSDRRKLVAAGRDAIVSTRPTTTARLVVLLRAAGSALDCGALWKRWRRAPAAAAAVAPIAPRAGSPARSPTGRRSSTSCAV